MKKIFSFIVALTVIISALPIVSPSVKAESASEKKLIWSDEFDGNTLNMSNWVYDVGYGYWGNNELEYYTRGDNIKVENGELAITAKKESYGGANYTSGRITTCGKQLFQYGTIEARIKMPVGQGIWPAFWMLGQTTSWPNGGEIDIMEHINSENTVYGTLHDWNGGNNVKAGGQMNNIDVTQYHVYRIDWNEDRITWYVDDEIFFSKDISMDNTYFPHQEVFHEPFYLLLNVAVGGDWPGDPVDSSFPATMYVDYVRVYEQDTIELDKSEVTLEIGETAAVNAEVSSGASVSWSSSDESVAVVDNGVIKGLKAGKATITAQAGTLAKTVQVTVKPVEFSLWQADNVKALHSTSGIFNSEEKIRYYNGRLFAPLRSVLSAAECTDIIYDDNTGAISFTTAENVSVTASMNKTQVYLKNNETGEITSDTLVTGLPAYIDGKAYLPIRDAASLAGYNSYYRTDGGYVLYYSNPYLPQGDIDDIIKQCSQAIK